MDGSSITRQRIHARLTGRVQGVGFRYFVQQKAQSLGVKGWVRNRWDRSVEAVAEGTAEQLESLLVYLRRGPRSSHVAELEVDWEPAKGEFTAFQIRMTD